MEVNLRAFGTEITGNRGPNCELSSEARASIYAASLAGTSVTQIATDFKVHRNTVTSTIKRFDTYSTFDSLPREGRPEVLSRREKRLLQREVKKNPRITWTELKTETSLPVYKNTIRVALGKDYRRKWRACKRIPLKGAIARERLEFTRFWKNQVQKLIEVRPFEGRPLMSLVSN